MATTKEQAISNINSVKSTSATDKANAIKALDKYYPTKTSTTNPAGTSTNYKGQVDSLGSELKSAEKLLKNQYDTSNLEKTYKESNQLIEDRMGKLESSFAEQKAGIKSDYAQAEQIQGQAQQKEYAGRATGLVTSGGGFLGATQSQEGVLQNLSNTHEQEKIALMGKRDAAIQAAQNAYDDKNFDLASAQLKLAKDTEQEMYNRQQDFNDMKLKILEESRSQQEYAMGVTDKKIENLSLMSDEEYAKISDKEKSSLDNVYGISGYTDRLRTINKKAQETKTLADEVSLKKDIQDLINATPAGKVIKIGDKTYVGVKKESGGSSIKDPISPSLANQLGIPNIANQSQEDIILSLDLQNPPQWYLDFYKLSSPESAKNLTVESLKNDWTLFRNLPEFTPFKNTVKIDKRSSSGFDISSVINADTINQAMKEAEL